MIKAALFDLDGVVVDSESQYTKFWGSQFQLYYPQEKGLEHRIKGMTLVEIFSSYFNGQAETQKAITDRLNEFERRMSYDYIAGFQDFIKKVKEVSWATAVVTSSNQQKMTNVFRCHPELGDYFDAVLTSEDFDKSKPDPDGYLKAAQRLHILPNECIGFEDSINGVKALNAAKMFVVGLATTNQPEALKPWCNLIVDDFTHLDLNVLLAEQDK